MDKSRREQLKKKAASVAASVAILVNGTFTDPSNLPDSRRADMIAAPPAYEYVADSMDDGDDDLLAQPEEEKKKRFSILSWYSSKSLRTRLMLSAAVCLAVWILFGALYAICSPALPLLAQFFVRAALLAALGLFTYVCFAKAFAPEVPLKDLMNWKIVLAIVLGACLLSYALKFLLSLLVVHN